jgi:hypothetical protein
MTTAKLAPAPATSISGADVIGWIREAATNRQRQRRIALRESDSEAKRVAQLVTKLREYYWRDRSRESYTLLTRAREVQKAVQALRANLPPLLQSFERAGPHLVYEGDKNLPDRTKFAYRPDPAFVALDQLFGAVNGAHSFIGDPPKPGRPHERWRVWANALIDPVRIMLVKAFGKEQLSLKPTGPLVRVLCCALAAIDGDEYDPQQVSSGLKRRH